MGLLEDGNRAVTRDAQTNELYRSIGEFAVEKNFKFDEDGRVVELKASDND